MLNALRRYRSAENAAQRRAREALGVGENALLALRVLLDAEQAGRRVNSKQLAEELGITAASTSALVDRLVRSGHVERPLPTPTTVAACSSRRPVSRCGRCSASSTSSTTAAPRWASTLDERDIRVILAFLEEMTRVVDHIAPEESQADDVAVA